MWTCACVCERECESVSITIRLQQARQGERAGAEADGEKKASQLWWKCCTFCFSFFWVGHDLTLRAGLCSDIITVKGSLLSRLCFFGLIFSHTWLHLCPVLLLTSSAELKKKHLRSGRCDWQNYIPSAVLFSGKKENWSEMDSTKWENNPVNEDMEENLGFHALEYEFSILSFKTASIRLI